MLKTHGKFFSKIVENVENSAFCRSIFFTINKSQLKIKTTSFDKKILSSIMANVSQKHEGALWILVQDR